MKLFWQIVIGVLLMIAGSFAVIRTRGIADFFGPIDWAEAKLGAGGTYLVYKVTGILVAFIGIIVATNLWDWFLEVTLGSILPSF